MRAIFVLMFSSFLPAIHCRKHNDQPPPDNSYGLPNATQTGANIFACRINGNNWVLKKLSSYNVGTSWSTSNNRDTLAFWASGSPDTILSLIRFSINRKIQQGVTYRLNDTITAMATALKLNATCGPSSGYGGLQWGKAMDGFVAISKFSGTYSIPACCSHGDYDAKSIIAGTFGFVIAIPGCDSMKVTDGRFDINYSQY